MRAVSQPVAEEERAASARRRAAAAIAWIGSSRALRPELVGALIAVGIVALVLLDLTDGQPAQWKWGLDAERTPAPVFSASLLLGTAALAVVNGLARSPQRGLPLLLFALLALFMAADEAFSFHERAEELTSVDWQLLYLPLFAVCGAAWVWILARTLRRRVEKLLWLAGAGAWRSPSCWRTSSGTTAPACWSTRG
ncbi:hypothetical protein [Conexibacter arvalis]|uniref:Uncharacterized protein n=1 Tax=Conexibacter arvalis TaxID=912552 RepID=A0A840IC18_9ACTN|nr:hypothetical protein [Conexibacter arvalis]MBB4661644.1 hypothetical protein [Conexibacter arvalis]